MSLHSAVWSSGGAWDAHSVLVVMLQVSPPPFGISPTYKNTSRCDCQCCQQGHTTQSH